MHPQETPIDEGDEPLAMNHLVRHCGEHLKTKTNPISTLKNEVSSSVYLVVQFPTTLQKHTD